MSEQGQNRQLMEGILYIFQNSAEINHIISGVEEGHPMPEEYKELGAAFEIIRFMDEMPGGFLIYRAEAGEEIVYANQALLRIFQCESMEQFRQLTGNSFRGLVHSEDLEEVEESIQNQIAASRYDLDYVEYRIIRRDGAVRWIEDYGHFVKGENGQSFFYVFLSDATEKRAQINQEYLRRLEVIEGLSVNYESILYADLEADKILPYRTSGRCEQILGGRSAVRSMSWTMAQYVDNWVHPEDRESYIAATAPDYIRQKLTGSKTYYFNYRVLSGTQVQYFQLRVVNVGRQGPPAQIVMGYRRVDEEIQREMEQKQILSRALNDATLAIDAKNTFLSNMSHDMRTPLNAIFGYTTLASRNRGDMDVLDNCLEQIQRASRQLMELINQVLELSQAESDDCIVEQTCDLCEILQSVCNSLRPRTEEKGISLTLNCGGIVHREVWSDRAKLRRIALNLVTNAVTYTGAGGRVSITVEEGEMMPNHYGLYRLTVEDNGLGISEEFLEHIFDPFAREKNTTFSRVHGVGLGLTITKKLVDMMGGGITVQSAEGRGSTFVVTLHLRALVQPEGGLDQAAFPAVQPGVQNILLVEDNEINLEVETEILKTMGFSIEAAMDGREALEKVSRARPGEYDLILMDIQMPVMDGWRAAEAIRGLPDPRLAQIPIIALSANIFESDVRKSKESGMDAHIPKPLDVSQLMQTIERVLRERRV